MNESERKKERKINGGGNKGERMIELKGKKI